jgi:polyketide synthase 12
VVSLSIYLDMALRAADSVTTTTQHVMEDLVFAQGMVLSDEESRHVQSVLSPDKAGNWTFDVFSRDSGESASWLHHLSARIKPRSLGNVPRQVSVDTLRHATPEPVDTVQWYADLEARGIALGPAHQGLKRLWRGEGQVLASLDLERRSGPTLTRTAWVKLIDACFQTCVAASPGDATHVVVGCERFELHDRLAELNPQAELWCYSSLDTESGRDGLVSASFSVFHHDGTVVAEASCVKLKRVTRETFELTLQASESAV